MTHTSHSLVYCHMLHVHGFHDLSGGYAVRWQETARLTTKHTELFATSTTRSLRYARRQPCLSAFPHHITCIGALSAATTPIGSCFSRQSGVVAADRPMRSGTALQLQQLRQLCKWVGIDSMLPGLLTWQVWSAWLGR